MPGTRANEVAVNVVRPQSWQLTIGLIAPMEKHANLSVPSLNGRRAEASLVTHPCDELIELVTKSNFADRYMPPTEKS
jgi:hypothetical protein